MKLDDLNRWLTLGANIGVIAGIVFLAVELRQNNELLAADARFNRLQMSWNGWQSLAENGDLTALIYAAENGDTLEGPDRMRVDAVFMRILIAMEWLYRELPADSPEHRYMRDELKKIFSGIGADRAVWNRRRSGLDPAFVAWVEENVLSN